MPSMKFVKIDIERKPLEEFVLDESEEFLCGVIMGLQIMFQRDKPHHMNIYVDDEKIDLDGQHARIMPYYLYQKMYYDPYQQFRIICQINSFN